MANVQYILLCVGLIAISALSILIARRVGRHLGLRWSALSHLLIGLLAVYYLIDLGQWSPTSRFDPYFLFWLLVLFIQLGFTLRTLQRASKLTGESHESSDNSGRKGNPASPTHTHPE